MPTQDLSELDTEQKRRLEHLAKNKKLESVETTQLLMEVNQDYLRTMNKIIFDNYLENTLKEEDESYPHHLNLPPVEAEKLVPYYGMEQLERHKGAKEIWMYNYKEIYEEEPKDFTETFKDFCFSSLFIKEEVIKALQEIKVECNKVLEMDVFNYEIGVGCMVLEEFKHIQESVIS